jgi:hypothetical protein
MITQVEMERLRLNDKNWDLPSARFGEWWNGNTHNPRNPFEKGSAAFWAYEGWQASLNYNLKKNGE